MRKDSRGIQDASGVRVGRIVGVGVGGEGRGIVVITYPNAMLNTTKMLRIKKMI
jgi:hypothetical protein